MLDEIALCVACNGSGQSSKGAQCVPCKGKGRNPEALRPNLTAHALALGYSQNELQQGAQALAFCLTLQHLETEQHYRMAADGVQHCKRKIAQTEERRKAVTQPLLDSKRSADTWANELKAPYEQAEKHLKAAMLNYQARQQVEREQIAQQMMASAGNIPQTMQLAAQVQQTIVPKLQGIQNRVLKRWRVVDANQIPRELYVLDERRVNECMRSGIAIPGIEYYEEQTIAAGK